MIGWIRKLLKTEPAPHQWPFTGNCMVFQHTAEWRLHWPVLSLDLWSMATGPTITTWPV